MRTQKKMTQEQLGFEAGLDRTYISVLERGQRSPTLDTLFALGCALDVDFSHLAKMTQKVMERDNERNDYEGSP